MDLAKTQFLIEDHYTHKSIKQFRRKRQYMLFKGEEPLRLMSWKEWMEFQAAWPDECREDRLSLRSVWTLVPVA